MSDEKPHTYESLCIWGRNLLELRDSPTAFPSLPGFGCDPFQTLPLYDPSAAWNHAVAGWLDTCFPNSGYSAAWSVLQNPPWPDDCRGSEGQYWCCFNAAIRERLKWLADLAPKLPPPARAQLAHSIVPPTISRRVFVVHGHNEAARETVARFLKHIGLDPVILHEQPNKGRTIIEKFESNADVGFAVVLFTADDLGRRSSADAASLTPRARQNVLFELGYFLGKLGRERVCALLEEGVEIPSDYNGVLYVKLDTAETWHAQLVMELRAAGLPVDLNDP